MSMESWLSLAKTAGEVAYAHTQRESAVYDARPSVGSGKLEEIAQMEGCG